MIRDHIYGQVDDCVRCINCEMLPGRTIVCEAFLDDDDLRIPEDWEDYADEREIALAYDDAYLAPKSYRYDY